MVPQLICRLREFLIDFDRLRKGEILPSHFTRGLMMAGVDKFLTPTELTIICKRYTVPKTASMEVVEYNKFLADVDIIFTKPVSSLEELRSASLSSHHSIVHQATTTLGTSFR